MHGVRVTIGQVVLATERLQNRCGYFEQYSELQITEINIFSRYSLVDEYGNEIREVSEDYLILPEEKDIYEKNERTIELKFILAFVMMGLILSVCIGFLIYQYIF